MGKPECNLGRSILFDVVIGNTVEANGRGLRVNSAKQFLKKDSSISTRDIEWYRFEFY